MLSFASAIVDQTLAHLHDGGSRNCETAVLWLGRRSDTSQVVAEVYRPEQTVALDYFRIPASGMRALLSHLRERRLQLLAQVHSHPEHAFHSKADDKWAIVRHVGALSLVVPWFAARTTGASFLDDVALFRLDEHDAWRPVDARAALEFIS